MVFNSVFLPPFSLPCLSLSPSLSLSLSLSVSMPPAKAFSFFSLLCPHYAPICVTHEAWLSVKNNRWKGNRRMQKERWGGWWLGLGIWRGEEAREGREGGLALEAPACRRELKKHPIHQLFIYLFWRPLSATVVAQKQTWTGLESCLLEVNKDLNESTWVPSDGRTCVVCGVSSLNIKEETCIVFV